MVSFPVFSPANSQVTGMPRGIRWMWNQIQSTLVISTSVISNNRLSRRKNLVPVITQKSKIRL